MDKELASDQLGWECPKCRAECSVLMQVGDNAEFECPIHGKWHAQRTDCNKQWTLLQYAEDRKE